MRSGSLHNTRDGTIPIALYELITIEWFRRYKSTLYCMDCGENHPACLHFHHRKDEDKKFTIASVVSRANSLRQIINEIKKCDVLCANCHAIRHWRETHEFDDWTEVLPQ